MLNNRKHPMEERMVLFIYVTMALSVLMIVVMNIVQGLPMVNNMKWLVFIMFIGAAAFAYIKRESMRRQIRNISSILIIFVVFPMLFIFSGGLRAVAKPCGLNGTTCTPLLSVSFTDALSVSYN